MIVPARIDHDGELRSYCACCQRIHLHHPDAAPVNQCDPASLSSHLGFEIIHVAGVDNDFALAALARDVWLESSGWRECSGGGWLHRVHGRRSTANACLLQRGLDAVHAHHLSHQVPHPC